MGHLKLKFVNEFGDFTFIFHHFSQICHRLKYIIKNQLSSSHSIPNHKTILVYHLSFHFHPTQPQINEPLSLQWSPSC
jgi:hypothetical protein